MGDCRVTVPLKIQKFNYYYYYYYYYYYVFHRRRQRMQGARGLTVLLRVMGPIGPDSQPARGSVMIGSKGHILARAWQAVRGSEAC